MSTAIHLCGFGMSAAADGSALEGDYATAFGAPPALGAGEREYRKARWPDPVTLVGLRAARRALADLDPGDRRVDLIIATDTAGWDSRARFREELALKNGRAANPTRFLSGLFNVPAATIASELDLSGRSLSLCLWDGGEIEAFETACAWLAAGSSTRVLVGCIHAAAPADARESAHAAFFRLESGGEATSLARLQLGRTPGGLRAAALIWEGGSDAPLAAIESPTTPDAAGSVCQGELFLMHRLGRTSSMIGERPASNES